MGGKESQHDVGALMVMIQTRYQNVRHVHVTGEKEMDPFGNEDLSRGGGEVKVLLNNVVVVPLCKCVVM